MSQPSDTEESGAATSAAEESEAETEVGWNSSYRARPQAKKTLSVENVAEVIFFEYGVAVFFGFSEEQELSVLEDITNASIPTRKWNEDDWEIEECYFTVSTATRSKGALLTEIIEYAARPLHRVPTDIQ